MSSGDPNPAAGATDAASPAKKRVLVIDDEASVALTLRRILARDYDVEICTDSRDAAAVLSARDFDAILCDLMMPHISGRTLFENLSRNMPDKAEKFVFMSGGATSNEMHTFLEQHANGRLDKPFTAQELRSVVARIVEASR